MKKHVFYWLAVALIGLTGCQKEVSFEAPTTPSVGSLQSDASGDCLPKTINGTYVAALPLGPAINTITVQVNVTQTGTYIVSTDTVNGYYFRTTGTFTALGSTNVTLRSNGTPFAAGVNNFIVSYNGSICDIAITVLPAGTGAAVFTLNGAPGACTGAVVNGTYATGTALNASNTVALNVTVTTIGTYNITTTFQGMTFTGSGAFATTGANTATLVGTGTPTTGGANLVPVTVGATTCNFTINVGSPAVFTLAGSPGNCTTPVIAGTYSIGIPLTAANTVTLNVNVTTAGAYAISTVAVGGMTFSGTGTLATGAQTIVLTGSGTPSTGGNNTIAVVAGSSNCNFIIPVTGGAAVFTLAGIPGNCTTPTIAGSYALGTALSASNTITLNVNVTTAGSYTVSTTAVGGMTFLGSGTLATGAQTIVLTGAGTPTVGGNNVITVTVGGSSCTFTINVVVLSTDYFPRTTGSNWSYEFDDNGTDSLYRNVIAPTHTAGGNTYNIFFENDGSGPDSSGYYRKSGTDYFEYFDIGFDASQWVEYIMIKDQPAGVTWTTAGYTGTISAQPFTIRFKFTILLKDVPGSVTTTLGMINYNNVIVIEEKVERFITGTWVDLTPTAGYGKSYYARGVGLIKYEQLNAANVITGKQELRRSQVF